MYDVAIIGAGVVGGMTARALSKFDLKICILEKENDVAMGATKANSAIVHAGFDAKENSLKAKLNVAGSKMMESVCKDLGVRYKNNGSLVIGFNEEDKAVLKELLVRGQNNGVEGLEILEGDALKQHESGLSEEVTCALFAPTGAIVCPYDLTVAAIGNAMDNGADLVCNFHVEKIEKADCGYKIFSKDSSVTARYVINCAGIFSDAVAKLVGDDSFTIKARRGEYILLDKECGNLVSKTIFPTPSKMGKGILVSPTVDGNLLLGPTSVDMDEKENKNVTSGGFEDILKKARKNIPFVPVAKTITSFCGLRSVGSTGDFIINSPVSHFINAAGIESPGLSASPAIALYIVDLLKEQGLNLTEKENYNPKRASAHRFRDASLNEKNEMIKQNSAYGKIVCRCEGITEGEILDALRTNPKARDLDGVKRRTRAQMGRCQGGFCTPYITELIAKELNVPFESVTKFGGNSFVNLGKTKGGR